MKGKLLHTFLFCVGCIFIFQLAGLRQCKAAASNNLKGSELFDFTLLNEGRSINISWKLSASHNYSHVVIYYATDGKNFAPLATVEAEYALDERNYTYSMGPRSDLNYFYMALVDIDGNTINSAIKMCKASVDDLAIFPNPVKDEAHLVVTANEVQEMECWLYTIHGDIVGEYSIPLRKGKSEFNVDVAECASGQYLLVANLNGKRITMKIYKE